MYDCIVKDGRPAAAESVMSAGSVPPVIVNWGNYGGGHLNLQSQMRNKLFCFLFLFSFWFDFKFIFIFICLFRLFFLFFFCVTMSPPACSNVWLSCSWSMVYDLRQAVTRCHERTQHVPCCDLCMPRWWSLLTPATQAHVQVMVHDVQQDHEFHLLECACLQSYMPVDFMLSHAGQLWDA